jgi:hypothetical protein
MLADKLKIIVPAWSPACTDLFLMDGCLRIAVGVVVGAGVGDVTAGDTAGVGIAGRWVTVVVTVGWGASHDSCRDICPTPATIVQAKRRNNTARSRKAQPADFDGRLLLLVLMNSSGSGFLILDALLRPVCNRGLR